MWVRAIGASREWAEERRTRLAPHPYQVVFTDAEPRVLAG
ncbi:hypothetical protein AOX55_00002090 [Sinorhizobium fredii CCBAU 25509]|nr:hypothetical protein AOX55_00002090 [Sinorhizobium fredii CCBAU 25509]